MKVKKGDLVQMLTGKDRGKRGRVVEARPSERRGIGGDLDVAERDTKPRQAGPGGRHTATRAAGDRREPERRDATYQATPDPRHLTDGWGPGRAGRDPRQAVGRARAERHGRLPRVRPPDAGRHGRAGSEGRNPPRPCLQARELRPGDRPLMADAPTMETYAPR